MPLLTFDLIEGRTEQEVKTLLDAAHRAVLRAFELLWDKVSIRVHNHSRTPMTDSSDTQAR